MAISIGAGRARQLAMISHLGAMIPVVVGKLLAKRMKGEKGFVGLTTIGEGGMQTGATHEGMNIAAVEHVPLVIVATNNHYAYSTPNDRQFACADLVDRAIGYGFEGYNVDGTNLSQCLDVIGGAVKRARAGGPPQLVVASTLRLAGHGEHDDASYVCAEMKCQPFAQDCLGAPSRSSAIRNSPMQRNFRIMARGSGRQSGRSRDDRARRRPDRDEEDWCAISTRELVDQIP